MSNTATIATRIDPKLKAKATKIVEGLGLDLSSVLRAFVYQITLQNRIPLNFSYPDAGEREYDPEFVKMVLESNASYEAGNYVEFKDHDAFRNYMLSGGKDASGAIVHKG